MKTENNIFFSEHSAETLITIPKKESSKNVPIHHGPGQKCVIYLHLR